MKPQEAIPAGVTASAIAHLSILVLVFLFSEVHPFGSVTARPIAVDIVAPHEITPPKPEPPPVPQPPSPDLSLLKQQDAAAPPPSATQGAAAARPQQQAALPAPQPRREAAAPPQATLGSSSPGYVPPAPDLSIKYHVMLGLPPELPPSRPRAKSGDAFDDASSKAADIGSNLVAEFRRHLKTCSALPKSIAPNDPVRIVLRAFLAPDGKLAAEPILIEASASAKGPLLMQSAISALESCQPYAMLPVERYGEWKVLDLSFTPRDFAS